MDFLIEKKEFFIEPLFQKLSNVIVLKNVSGIILSSIPSGFPCLYNTES